MSRALMEDDRRIIGVRQLRTLRIGLCLCLLVAGHRLAFAAEDTAKTEKSVDAFIEKSDKMLKTAHNNLLRDIKKAQTNIKRSDRDPDAKKLVLERVQRDLDQCNESTNALPSSDELLGLAIAYANKNQDILDQIERKRKLLLDKSIKTNNPAAESKLTELHNRVSKLLDGRVAFEQGSDWVGSRVGTDGNAVNLSLHFGEVSGGSFAGQLHQINTGGRPDIMNVEGTRDGTTFSMTTTGMVRGAARSLEFDGCVVGSRIVAQLRGTNAGGKPAAGWISLTKK